MQLAIYVPLYLASFAHFLFHIAEHHQLRLVNGWKLGAGRVEILDDGRWKAVCILGWDLDDSNVVCHQLKFPGASRWYPSFANKKDDYFDGLGKCHGNESFLDECLSGSNACFNNHANVAVECKGVSHIHIHCIYAYLYMCVHAASIICTNFY